MTMGWRRSGRRDETTATPQDVYTELMKTAFAPALRAEGMRGSAGRFELPSDRYWAQLGFQKSQYSDGQEVRFTINLSVIDRAEWESQLAEHPYLGPRPTPTSHYGRWARQQRIGHLAPDRADKWWRLVRGADAAPVRDDVLHDLLAYALPWLREQMDERPTRS